MGGWTILFFYFLDDDFVAFVVRCGFERSSVDNGDSDSGRGGHGSGREWDEMGLDVCDQLFG